jgi:NifB/MoaA-like Fe-S oxidoreductase
MIRSFLNSFERLLNKVERAQSAVRSPRSSAAILSDKNTRTHRLAVRPKTNPKSEIRNPKSLNGTVLTGEMFAPILRGQLEKLNVLTGANLRVLAVPNTYFGGDVAVAGLLTGRDYLAVKEDVAGDFVIIPKHTIKSDEPILLDGMTFAELQEKFPLPIHPMSLDEFIDWVVNEG